MIKLFVNVVVLLVTFRGLIAFAFLRNHLVATLLRLEFASLSVYLMLFNTLVTAPSELYLSLVYLTLAACEGALGLSLLVAVIKHKGNDFITAPSLTQC
ncbi:MAG: NADH dehydrogenase subunit 4L [Shewanella sp.]